MDSLPPEFKILATADGSPTLAFDDGRVNERMHNSQGALGESLYVYGQAVEQVFTNQWPLRVISVGLGLGYNELIAAAHAASRELNPEVVRIWSFENNSFLREAFFNWLRGYGSALAVTYDQILAAVAREFSLEPVGLRNWMTLALDQGTLDLRGPFPEETTDVTGATCILYDAYCSKSSPALWDQEMLQKSLAQLAGERCIFATYAATGALKRALVQSRFQLQPRSGFGGKRDSTWGVRS